MKRGVFLFVVLFTFSSVLHAQRSMIESEDKVISLGMGIGNTLYIGGKGYSTIVPPLSLSYEQVVADDIFREGVLGIVGSLGYTSYRFRYTADPYDFGWDYHNIILGAGSLLHYPLVNRLDTYIGALLGYNFTSVSEYRETGDNEADSVGGFLIAGFVGARYYFTDQFAAFAQVGYGVAYLTIGVSYRL
jgi:hypothetical protein